MPDVEEQTLKYASSCGRYMLSGTITRPVTPTGKLPPRCTVAPFSHLSTSAFSSKCIVLVHGGMANKNSFYHKHMAANLTGQLGYCTFRFDFVGNGEVCLFVL